MDKDIVEYDTVVIGASISGSIVATLLGNAGRSVLLIDPQLFPRRKACGEGLSILGQQYLVQIGLWSPELEQSCTPFYGYTIYPERSNSFSIEDHRSSSPQGFGISRVLLDSSIYSAALRCPEVELSTSRVREIERQADRWQIQTSTGESASAAHLVLACGSAGLSTLFPDLSTLESGSPRYGLAFWAQGEWQGGGASKIHVHHFPEGQYILTPLSSSCINISVLLSKQHKISKSQISQKLRSIADKSGFRLDSLLDSRGARAIQSCKLIGNTHPFYVIGDAVERFDPIGGMGMTHAIYSAILAAKYILSHGAERDSALFRYYRERKQGAKILGMLTSLSYGLNVSQNLILQKFVSISPMLAAKCIASTRSLFPAPQVFGADIEHSRSRLKEFSPCRQEHRL